MADAVCSEDMDLALSPNYASCTVRITQCICILPVARLLCGIPSALAMADVAMPTFSVFSMTLRRSSNTLATRFFISIASHSIRA